LGTIDGQVDCMIREITRSHLIDPLNSHDWAHVARIYNGAGYRANRYDEKLAEAFKRCARLTANTHADVGPALSLSAEDAKRVQRRLDELGYHVAVDGHWGAHSTGALAAFQAYEGLRHDGRYTQETAAALDAAQPKAPDRERAVATAADLRDAGSDTVRHADHVDLWGRAKLVLGVAGAGSAGAERFGLLDSAKGASETMSEWRDVLNSLGDVGGWALRHWWLFALLAGIAAVTLAERIRAARLADHRSGRHTGPGA